MAERKLADVRVEDMRRLIVERATTVGPDTTVRSLLGKLLEDSRTRHAYVVDEAGCLVGSVRLNAVLKHLFPLSSANDDEVWRPMGLAAAMGSEKVRDIMNASPCSVHPEMPVLEMVKIMVAEQVSELPVVDQQNRVVGEANFLEVIAAYLAK